MEENNNMRSRGLLTVLGTMLIVLVVLSFFPWDMITGGNLKRFNLFSDLFPHQEQSYISNDILDPELAALDVSSDHVEQEHIADIDEQDDNQLTDAFYSDNSVDTISAPQIDGNIVIEDYSVADTGISTLRSTFAKSASSLVRIAILGDSYIEGDIFSQDVRSALQDRYGGCGVGYVPAFTTIPGFRQSVRQSGSGWTEHEIKKMKSNDLRALQGIYFTGESGAKALYKGSKRPSHVDIWTSSVILFVAPNEGTITITASDGLSQSYTIEPSDEVQTIRYEGATSEFGFTSDIAGLKVLGVWLDGATGVSVDNMSLRGNSGISHRNLNASIISQMRQIIDYDLIILEFGINALSSEQSDYTAYGKAMVEAVNTIRSCYPNAQILIMGIGDRGQKHGTEVGSMATVTNMVRTLRGVARCTGSLFWDTRSAMGGNGAAVDWHKRGLINSDYIHLNHKGGKQLAEIFINSLTVSLGE